VIRSDRLQKALLSAYAAKARAVLAQHKTDTSSAASPRSASSDGFESISASSSPVRAPVALTPTSSSSLAELDALHARFRRWVDSPTSDPAFALVHARRELVHKRCVAASI